MKVLFIDDDGFMLKALMRTAKRLRPHWLIACCEHPEQWLEANSGANQPDIIICDYLMPTLGGDQVLLQASAEIPAAVRVLLTGDTSEQVVSQISAFSHHIMAKPFSEKDLNSLFTVVERLHQLPFDVECREHLGRIRGLPVQSDILKQLNTLLANEATNLSDIAGLLSHEPVLSAKVLQLANSAFLGFSRSCTTIHEGVIRLGAKLVEAVVSMHVVDDAFRQSIPEKLHQSLSDWAFKHAVLSADLAKKAGFLRAEQEQIFSAAIFGAIGRLIVISQNLNEVPRDRDSALLMSAARTIQSGFDDSTIASVYMLTLWGYDADLCNVLLWQDTPTAEANTFEHMSFILFLVKQFLLSNNKDQFDKLHSFIKDVLLSNAFKDMVETEYGKTIQHAH